MVSRDVPEFLALGYLENLDPTLIYLASPYAHASAKVRNARLEAVRLVCGKLVNQGKIVLSPMVYLGELAAKGVHPPQGWYAFDLQLLVRSDELLVLQLPAGRTVRECSSKSQAPRSGACPSASCPSRKLDCPTIS